MSAALDYPTTFGGGIPHRKPLPTAAATSYHQQSYQPNVTGNDQLYTRQGTTHSHTRSVSSTALPSNAAPPQSTQAYANTMNFSQPMSQNQHQPLPLQQQHSQAPPVPQPSARRTLSNATSSTSSTSNNNLARVPTTPSFTSGIRRSTSSRSTTPTSYVALMRKQKATVWCDRAQHEDPRLLAAQRAAKMRATMEVVGGHNAGRTTTGMSSGGLAGGVRSKIRHHGAPKASAYSAAANSGSGPGLPMRLSASEVDEEGSDDERDSGNPNFNARYHNRNGSGRSSLGSGQRATSYMAGMTGPQQQGLQQPQQYGAGRFSNGSTPPSAASYSPDDHDDQADINDPGETPGPDTYSGGAGNRNGGGAQKDYFQQSGGQGNSTGSGSSGEEARFGEVSNLPRRSQPVPDAETIKKTSEELRRRGSVDDRTMTMSGVRLFVANPDLSD